MPRILGIDTSLRSTGLGVVAIEGSRCRAILHRRLAMAPGLPHTACLLGIGDGVREAIRETSPDAAAIEGAFFSRNVRTAMILGQARGAALYACAAEGLPVFEYAPRRVKQAVVGFGAASKEQMRRMIQSLLALDALPQEDEADALALALCHAHTRSGIPGREGTAI